jgi:hypothetical protein
MYHRQLGHKTLIEYFAANSLIFSSHSIFPVSLKPAEIIITLFIHFFQHSSKAPRTNAAGITITAASGTIGNSQIEGKNCIHSKLHHLGFTQNFCPLNSLIFISKSFQIFQALSEAHMITTESISKKLVFIVVWLNN